MPNFALLGAAVCLLIAVAIGAYRQWYLRLLKTVELDMPETELEADEGPVPDVKLSERKFWRVRIATWFLVTALSVDGAALRTSQLDPPGVQRQQFAFLSILLIRWILSAVVGRSYAIHTLRKHIRS
jgi:hypothetical protein